MGPAAGGTVWRIGACCCGTDGADNNFLFLSFFLEGEPLVEDEGEEDLDDDDDPLLEGLCCCSC